MSGINELTDSLKDLRQSIDILSKKLKKDSKQFQAQAKIKFEMASEKRDLDKLYQELGKKVYEKRKEDADNLTDLDQYIRKIDASIARIESLRLKLDDYKNSNSYASVDLSNDKKPVDFNTENISRDESSITINEEDLINGKSFKSVDDSAKPDTENFIINEEDLEKN